MNKVGEKGKYLNINERDLIFLHLGYVRERLISGYFFLRLTRAIILRLTLWAPTLASIVCTRWADA